MNKLLNVTFYAKSFSGHMSQILAGLLILKHKKIINLNLSKKDFPISLPYDYIGLIIIENLKIGIDVFDGMNFNVKIIKDFIKKIDFYYKRSYPKNLTKFFGNEISKKIFPLGLNYSIDCENRYAYYTQFFIRIINKFGHMLDISFFKFPNYKIFEAKPSHRKTRIIFLTRLWDKKCGGTSRGKQISLNRIKLAREIKRNFPNISVVGVEKNDYSMKMCPDLIIENKISNKANFLKLVKESSICIATTGLHHSIGWKFAEYVAASKAIVTEPLNYILPGDFKENQNYLKFSSIDECINCINFLLKNPNKIYEISKNNYIYYRNILNPEKLVRRILNLSVI